MCCDEVLRGAGVLVVELRRLVIGDRQTDGQAESRDDETDGSKAEGLDDLVVAGIVLIARHVELSTIQRIVGHKTST